MWENESTQLSIREFKRIRSDNEKYYERAQKPEKKEKEKIKVTHNENITKYCYNVICTTRQP